MEGGMEEERDREGRKEGVKERKGRKESKKSYWLLCALFIIFLSPPHLYPLGAENASMFFDRTITYFL